MRTFSKYSLLVLIGFFIAGCGSSGLSQPSPSSGSLPQWFLNPKMSDPAYYYGVGEGSSKDNAQANALAQIGGKISVSISSELDISTTVANDKFSESVKSQTKSSIENIKFTGIDIIENAYVAGTFYTYLKVDRAVLFAAQKDAMEIEFSELKSLFKSAKENNIFELIKQKSKLEGLIAVSMSKQPILKAINAEFNPSSYINVLSAMKEELRKSSGDAMVYVTHSDAGEYAEVVKNSISTYGMTLVDSPKSVTNNKNLLKVKVTKTAKPKNVKSSDPRLIGASFADVIITLETRDYSEKIIAQNRVQVLNISKDGYEAAVIKTPKFEREIQTRGILNILLDSAAK